MNDQKKIGVIVIGTGRYFLEAHSPIIDHLKTEGKVEVIALVDFKELDSPDHTHKSNLDKFKRHHEPTRIIDADPEWRETEFTKDNVADWLNTKLGTSVIKEKYKEIAVVVSTSSTAHEPYLKWALEEKYHVLADKPLTVPQGLAVDSLKAAKIITDYDELTKEANKHGLLFMLATQKRYSDVFTEMAKHIRKLRMLGMPNDHVPVMSITYETNDGYWLVAKDDYSKGRQWQYGKERFAYKAASGAGKVTHTGYHILDIIPWLIRNGDPNGIDNAVVYASFWRPQDSFTTFPLQRDRDGKFSLVPDSEREGLTGGLGELSEVNAQIQIAFRCGTQKRCQVMLNFLHEGISGGCKLGLDSRVKYEQMNLHQGPAGAASFRRLAKLDPNAKDFAVGGAKHIELLLFKNKEMVEMEKDEDPIKDVQVRKEDDRLPARDFFDALLGKHTYSEVVSPVWDHSLGIQLMAAVYKSAISDLTTDPYKLSTFPRPINVKNLNRYFYNPDPDSERILWGPPKLYESP